MAGWKNGITVIEDVATGEVIAMRLGRKKSENVHLMADDVAESKTPNEMLKALEQCAEDGSQCERCPYNGIERCGQRMALDLRMYVRKLEKENEWLKARIKYLDEQCNTRLNGRGNY